MQKNVKEEERKTVAVFFVICLMAGEWVGRWAKISKLVKGGKETERIGMGWKDDSKGGKKEGGMKEWQE